MASPSMIKSARRFAVAAGAFALAGLAASPASSQNSPWGPPGDAAYKPFDVTYQNYHFRDGETLPSLRVHYLTLGTPHRDAQGQIDNAVLVLHWTSADSKAWIFTLRDGLEFHDGQQVTSEDVVASLQRWGQRDTTGETLLASVAGWDVVDARTFRMRAAITGRVSWPPPVC